MKAKIEITNLRKGKKYEQTLWICAWCCYEHGIIGMPGCSKKSIHLGESSPLKDQAGISIFQSGVAASGHRRSVGAAGLGPRQNPSEEHVAVARFWRGDPLACERQMMRSGHRLPHCSGHAGRVLRLRSWTISRMAST